MQRKLCLCLIIRMQGKILTEIQLVNPLKLGLSSTIWEWQYQNYIHKGIKSTLHSGNACYHSVLNLFHSCLTPDNFQIINFTSFIWVWENKVTKPRRMKWVKHHREMRNAYRILGWKTEGKRLFWRYRHRWEDNIKMDLTEIGDVAVEWIQVALVNRVMNLQVS